MKRRKEEEKSRGNSFLTITAGKGSVENDFMSLSKAIFLILESIKSNKYLHPTKFILKEFNVNIYST